MNAHWRWWLRVVAVLVPRDARAEWIEEWSGELAARGARATHALGMVSDAWYLRTEGWTMSGMWRDVRTAVGHLVRRPFFTVLAGTTLAVGIGANAAIYSVVDAVLINPLPIADEDRVVSYNHEAPGLGVNVPVIPHSQALYLHYHERARDLASFAVIQQSNVNLTLEGEPQRLGALEVTEDYFDVLGAQPILGRTWVEGEDRPGAEPVAVLGHGLWERTFGGDPSILGRLVEMNGVQHRVVGVMPRRVSVLDEELWLPMTIDRDTPDAGSLGLIGVARLADGATVESADAEMHELLLRFAEANPDEFAAGILEQAGLDSDVKPLRELLVQDIRPVLWVLLGTVAIVLLVACANVANLFLVRAEGRVREQAVRTAMGASRLDIVRQHLTESVTLSLAAGLLGLGIAALGVQGLLRLIPADLPQALDIGIDGSVLAFTATVSVLSGLLFGVVPTLGFGGADVSKALKDGGRASTGGVERMRARSVLVVAQVAMALVLLVGSGLMLRSFSAIRSVDLGFEAENVLAFRVSLPAFEYASREEVVDFYRALDDRLMEMPGARRVGVINGLPLTDSKSAGPMEPGERPFPADELAPLVERRQVTPGYFDAMSIRIIEGRGLEWTDQGDEVRSVVVSRALAVAFWPGESPVGRQIRNQGSDVAWEIVGVAEDVRFDAVQDEPLPMAYLPVVGGTAESPSLPYDVDVVVALQGDPLAAVAGAREALRSVAPRLPFISPRGLESVVSDSLAATSITVLLLGVAAAIALLLGTVGLYGVIAYIVSRRTQEIGVRMALGAPAAVVLRGIMRQGVALVAVGLGLGLVASLAMSRVLASLLFGVSPTDPLTFAGTAAVLAVVSVVAMWVPARRAAGVDPVRALRAE